MLRIIRRGTGSVVTWRRAQMVLLSAQGMPVAKIAEVTFTSADRVRDVVHNFNADGFDSLYPKYKGGRPRTFTLPERREIKKIAKSKPAEHGLPFWAAANNVKIAYTPTNSSWLNRIEAQFHRPALLRPRRHRPRQPQGTGQHDPPLHHLAEQARRQRTAARGRQQGERCLMRH